MSQIREIQALIHKELLQEWKQKNTLAGILIYVVSTVFLCYFAIKQTFSTETYNALFWIIVLFTGVNSVSKSFLQDSDERLFYYYQMASAQGIILSKMIYNALFMILLSGVAALTYILFLGNLIQNWPLFTITLIIACSGFGIILSLVSAIASKTGNNPTIMAILSFPIILPFLGSVIGLSSNAIQGIESEQNLKFVVILLGMNGISLALGYLLFPYLWRD